MSEECNAVREMPTRHLNFTKFPRLKLYLRTIILDWTIISTQLGVILRCFLRYEYLTYRYSFRGESYKLNVGRDLSDAKFNQSILQIKKVNPNKPRQLPPRSSHPTSGRTGIQTHSSRPLSLYFFNPMGASQMLDKEEPTVTPTMSGLSRGISPNFEGRSIRAITAPLCYKSSLFQCSHLELRLRFPV